tara:strand:- start:2700 stop:3035 length:336 start_codon:yes stop_codon:yes gene_type:complete
MAKKQHLSVQESLNSAGFGGTWTVNSAATHGGTGTGNTVHLDVSGAGQIGVYAAGAIYFNFSASSTDCNTSNDLKIPAETLVFLTVPQGLGSTVYFNHLGVAACAVRVVEV